ncbi:bifunctional diguanylate cyclase/phosphodiesterase [Qipengyuania sp. 1NDW9]|uniref:putative bifunctional diguanylate cyclase/phosphodiesterase n=1 Tax=Qipengyuania xiapuensis TaxID=2867236 RepID=UPI001C873910|nr:bifunctional diguanylate cyclase/phosphodiesterase [Qipengyuania xiapuensis]
MIFAPLAALAGIVLATAVLGLIGPSSGLVTLEAVLAGGLVAFGASIAGFAIIGLRHLRKLESLSNSDALTGLPNRKALHRDIQQAIASELEVAIALVDLDGFKAVNDHYGHMVGDKAIKMVAKIVPDVCGDEASIYRLNGDEFAIVMTGQLAGTLLEGQCRRLIDRMGKTIKVEERRLTLGASAGLSRCNPGDGIDSAEMLRRADVAMNASKRGGKMRCTWFNEAFDRSREQLKDLEDELRTALSRDEFRVHYQPLVDAETRQITTVECLLRWERPDGKEVGPAVFIPVAEESGLINPIGLWVLRQACCDALEWEGITLSVNISAAQLRNPEFPIQLGHILEETGFAPERLELEITETCLVLDPVVAERSLDLIRGFGVRVALDDFGTGYASIGFLRQFRFEKLKIDRSLVAQAHEDDGSRAIMVSSITLARAMNMDVTAEGVETEEQAAMVRAAGCDQVQGWLYFKAMPADELVQHLNKPVDRSDSAIRPDKGSKVA